jgi:hypothetical protein
MATTGVSSGSSSVRDLAGKGNVVPVLINEEIFYEDERESGVVVPALDGSVWSALGPDRFACEERAPCTHWIGGWVDPRTGLDAVEKNVPCRKSNPGRPPRHYTD